MTHSAPTKGFSRTSPEAAMLRTLAKCRLNPPTSTCLTLSADEEPKSQGHCWMQHHKVKISCTIRISSYIHETVKGKVLFS